MSLRRRLGALALLAASAPAFAQIPKSRALANDDRIVNACNELGRAILGGDLEGAVRLTNPRLSELIGRDRVIAALKAAVVGNPDFTPLDMRCDVPSQQTTTPGLRLALVPTVMRARVAQGTVLLSSHYIASSRDNGASWSFIFLNPDATPDQLKLIFPDGLGDMHLPPASKPILLSSPPAPASAASAP